jgi:hypothetical protein
VNAGKLDTVAKAEILAAYDLEPEPKTVAAKFGIRPLDVKRIVKERDAIVPAEVGRMYLQDVYKEHMERDFRQLMHVRDLALEQTIKAMPEASAMQAATVWGIATDKMQFLKVEVGATAMGGSHSADDMSDEEMVDLLARALQQIKGNKEAERKIVEVYEVKDVEVIE